MVKSASDLRNADWIWKSDPYFVVRVVNNNGNKVCEAQTTTEKEINLNPVRSEELVFAAFLISICSFQGSADEGVCGMPPCVLVCWIKPASGRPTFPILAEPNEQLSDAFRDIHTLFS